MLTLVHGATTSHQKHALSAATLNALGLALRALGLALQAALQVALGLALQVALQVALGLALGRALQVAITMVAATCASSSLYKTPVSRDTLGAEIYSVYFVCVYIYSMCV